MPSSKLSALLVRHPPLGSGNEAESLTSWLLRLANGNGFRTYGELFSYERRKLSRAATLDVDPQRWGLLHSLHELSLLPESTIARHVLDAELAALTANAGTGNVRWTLTSQTCCAAKPNEPTCLLRSMSSRGQHSVLAAWMASVHNDYLRKARHAVGRQMP